MANTMNFSGITHRFLDWLAHLFGRKAEFDAVDGEEFARWARDLGMTTSDLKTIMSRWPRNGNLLEIRLERSGLGHLSADWRNVRLKQDLQRVCGLCKWQGRCERDLYKEKSDDWPDYCPNAPTIRALSGDAAK